jgi:cytochrome P450 family 9
MWPPAILTTRECNRDYKMDLNDGRIVDIKANDVFMLPIYSLHHDERYFPNPEKFDPYRFGDDRKDEIIAGSYIPFGYGPRACIGSRFALMEVKLLIFNILSKFTFEVCEKTPEKLEMMPSFTQIMFKEKIFVELKARQ